VRWLEELKATLDRGRQRRTLPQLDAAIKHRLRGQHLPEILHATLKENKRSIELQCKVDTDALDELERTWLGRLVLMTDQHNWSTEEIIRAYRGQSAAESVFRSLKDPLRLAIRPQYHWTDQKIHVHAFICVTAYLLSTLVHLTAKREAHYNGSADSLFEMLTNIRSVKLLRPVTKGEHASLNSSKASIPTSLRSSRLAVSQRVSPLLYTGNRNPNRSTTTALPSSHQNFGKLTLGHSRP
jgi:hypothetical protein